MVNIECYKDKVYICWSYHHILCAIERVLVNKENADIVIVFKNGNLPYSIYKRLVKHDVFGNVYYFEEHKYDWEISKKRIVKYIYNRIWGMPRYFDRCFPIELKEYRDIYSFYDASMVGAYLHIKKIPYHLIEDAKRAFSKRVLKRIEITIRKLIYNPNTLIKILKKIGYIIPIFGESEYCIDIEVDSANDLYRTVHNYNKFIVIPSKKYEKKLTEEDIDIIISVFSSKCKNDFSEKKILILTEPLKTNGVVRTFDEQKIIYQHLIDKILKSKSENIMIKPHPRDVFDYKLLLNNKRIELIDKGFPSEILSLISANCFVHVYTIDSSAILSFPREKSTMLGMEFVDSVLAMIRSD